MELNAVLSGILSFVWRCPNITLSHRLLQTYWVYYFIATFCRHAYEYTLHRLGVWTAVIIFLLPMPAAFIKSCWLWMHISNSQKPVEYRLKLIFSYFGYLISHTYITHFFSLCAICELLNRKTYRRIDVI